MGLLDTDFVSRHIGPRERDQKKMLQDLQCSSMEEFIQKVIPKEILTERDLDLGDPLSEPELFIEAKKIASENKIYKSWIGLGYANTVTPAVIKRNVLENPGWYTQYTPYQPEISQGRLEALLNFQTVIADLTGLPVANASLLDEGTAAVEALTLSFSEAKNGLKNYFVSKHCHPQTMEVLFGRAEKLGVHLIIEDHRKFTKFDDIFGALLQYPASHGEVFDYSSFIQEAKKREIIVTLACDLLSLVILKTPGEMGVDLAIGNSQRFGVPLWFGGPHAAFFASSEKYMRKVPGRIVGISKDKSGKKALRLALQTREQHIRREKASSNICTAQALLASMASMYAVYHGPEGLRKIANRVHSLSLILWEGLKLCKLNVSNEPFFDTVVLNFPDKNAQTFVERAWKKQINVRKIDDQQISISLDETTNLEDVFTLLEVFSGKADLPFAAADLRGRAKELLTKNHLRQTVFLEQAVFNAYHSETELMRYIKKLENKDLSLTYSMIPLGSCTMKLNAAAELMPVSWPEFTDIHPFAPSSQVEGYKKLGKELASSLAKLTGFSSVSLQPNSGAQGEYAGLLVVRAYQAHKGEKHRNVCLIPSSAHGTNPASAVLAGLKVVVVDCDKNGNIDFADLTKKLTEYKEVLSVFMLTYPSTHGVFEADIRKVCSLVHQAGGQVYLDGANMNAQVGLCFPGEYGPDLCHLNLHKTFCIPHGGGGPGAGPIAVKEHLAPFLPGHCFDSSVGGEKAIHSVSSALYGNAGILAISWAYIRMMGFAGLKKATQTAILNANYIAHRLKGSFEILYRGNMGYVAHECIIDIRPFKKSCGVEVFDIAKRLIDYGFHAPTVSFPVPGTLMIEPTESESLTEIERFCDAMIAIREEIRAIENGKIDRLNNPLKNAPHTSEELSAAQWDRPYTREEAVFPSQWVRENKFWPIVNRIDEAFGDRNFVCTCS